MTIAPHRPRAVSVRRIPLVGPARSAPARSLPARLGSILLGLTFASAAGAGVEFSVRDDWGEGMVVDVTIENDTGETIEDWRLSFETDKRIEQVWSADIVSREGNTVILEAAGWNGEIPSSGSVSFGFVASPGGADGLARSFSVEDIADGASSSPGSLEPGSPGTGSPRPAPPEPSPRSPPETPASPTDDDGDGEDGARANGKLGIVGTQLVDQQGDVVRLRGMSSHGLQWFGEYMNESSLRWLRDDWNANVVRAAMYTDPDANGYIANRALEEKVHEIVDAAIELDLYVIVDWHILGDNDPNRYRDEAIDFFDRVSTRYAGVPNVIYEIANEPNPDGPGGDVNWTDDIKPYAEAVVPAIRANAPDSVVIVGTATWSQDVDDAAASPLAFANIAYAMHFYACTHGDALRDKVDRAIASGAAIFVSEWGATRADGNGSVCAPETRTWIDFLDARDISWVNWSLADKDEASAALRPGASVSGGWRREELSTSGRLVRELMRD